MRNRIMKITVLAAPAAAVAVLAALGATSGAGASVRAPARPHAAHSAATRAGADVAVTPYPVTAQSQEFTTGINFCGGSGPCDGNGAAGGYGTIDRVRSGFSNGGFGNYAPFITALTGTAGWFATVDGTGDVSQGQGCPSAATEACTGPYLLPGTGAAKGAENVFGSTGMNGFTTTDDLFLQPGGLLGTNSQVDNDWAINNSSGTYGQEEVVSACKAGSGIALSFGNSSPGTCGVTADVSAAGWYRYVDQFTDNGGNAYVTASVYGPETIPGAADPGPQVFTSGPQPVGGTPSAVSNWGGPGYFWLPTEDQEGLPLANVAVQVGQHADGHTP